MQTCYPASTATRTTEPTLAQEPLTVAEARDQCALSQENTAHDAWLAEQIVAARRQVEYDLDGFVFYTGAHTLKLTSFGPREWFGLTKWPVTVISSITYVATDGDTDTWGSSEYALRTFRKTAIVELAYGYSWPTLRGDINGITVTFTAGHSSVVAVPSDYKALVRLALHTQWLYRMEQPEAAAKQLEAYERIAARLRPAVYA